ncbi:MAG: 4-demethylwyosine synthase TYW1 [Candidatus Pacearchaeota archaeon]|jgi:tRNA wybutosine-synthesizing protein 1
MTSKKLTELLKKQHYGIVGEHSAVQICRWAKKSLTNEGVCYKEKFYGIKSHLCCQMSPATVFCQNKCLHCWRAIEHTCGDNMEDIILDSPTKIIEDSIKIQRKLIGGFKGNSKVDMKKFNESQEPMQFAISLTGEPTLYPKLGEFIKELRKKGKTSFVVTNGLNTEVLKELSKKKQLPTQLYISLNSTTKEQYEKWHRSTVKNAWDKFNQTLELFPKLKTRKVVRMTLVKNANMNDEQVKEYATLIKKASPDFIEAKGYMSVGFARKRMGYEMMPTMEEIREYSNKLVNELKKESYKILDEHEHSRVVLIGKDKKRMKIKKSEI